MRYVSTRGRAPELGFCDALLAGLATDGLYVPQTWPSQPKAVGATYSEKAASLMAPYVEGEIPQDVFAQLCKTAYSTFRDPAVVPLVQIAPEHYLLELFHGPTLAFKDVALQLIGQLFDYVLTQRNQRVMIVGATSGDTGSAAIDGVKGCKNVDIVILYPNGRVSDVQRRQMTTVTSPNVHTVAIDGTFDDCQDLVKAMFNDAPFREANNLSAVNSINWARVMAQTVYYFTALETLGRSASFSVPTGNFGNVLAGWIAKQMGADIEKLIVGSNSNDILTRFFETHSMDMLPVVPTLSPSMDIQISSNFERLLFEMNNRDGGATTEQLNMFRQNGNLSVKPDQFVRWIEPTFRAHRASDEETLAVMKRIHSESGMLVDPHTAIGIASAEACAEPGVPTITLATAHPAKFPGAVKQATGVHPALPDHVADLFDRQERIINLPNDLQAVEAFVASCH
ncbi:MAG: threonine synthase [Actinobacteria bacterium]|nr:threonine synthase [Actinomycetota bacterium]